MTTEPETREQSRARLVWDATPAPGGPGADDLLDHLWSGLTDAERRDLTTYTTAVWEAAQLELQRSAIMVRVQHSARGPWGSALTILATDPEALAGLETGDIVGVLR